MSIGTGEGSDKVHQIDKALHHPLLDDIDLYSATGIIANFTGSSTCLSKTLPMHSRCYKMPQVVADVIPGIITDERMSNRVQLILIVTGIGATKSSFPNSSISGIVGTEAFDQKPVDTILHKIKEEPIEEIGINQYPVQSDQIDNLSIPAFLRRRSQK